MDAVASRVLTRSRTVAATVACLLWMVAFCLGMAVFGGTALLFGVRAFGGLWFLALVLCVGSASCLLSIWTYSRVLARFRLTSGHQVPVD